MPSVKMKSKKPKPKTMKAKKLSKSSSVGLSKAKTKRLPPETASSSGLRHHFQTFHEQMRVLKVPKVNVHTLDVDPSLAVDAEDLTQSCFGAAVDKWRELNLSPLVVLMSLIFWGWVLGPVGMVLAVPLTVILRIMLDRQPQTQWMATFVGLRWDSAYWAISESIGRRASSTWSVMVLFLRLSGPRLSGSG